MTTLLILLALAFLLNRQVFNVKFLMIVLGFIDKTFQVGLGLNNSIFPQTRKKKAKLHFWSLNYLISIILVP